MSTAEAICEEFCEEVFSFLLPGEPEEIKCSLHIDHFTALVERMVQIGYCCTQVQRDAGKNRCTAWFEPQTKDECTLF